MNKISVLIVFLFIALCLRCSYRQNEIEQAKIEDVWQKHEKVFVDLRQGRDVTIGAFDEACLFFGAITDVEIPAEHDLFIDRIATKDSHKALEGLRRWYAQNHDRLYWDEATGTVRIRPR